MKRFSSIFYWVLLFVFVFGFTACKQETPIEYALELTPRELTMFPGDEEQLHPVLSPAVDNADFSFKSKDEDVATVDAGGLITAVKRGEARIVASIMIEGKEYSAYCNVTVKNKELTINKSELDIFVGESDSLVAVMNDGSTPAITWSSDNETIATVENGVVKAVSAGAALIKASCTSKGHEYQVECTVKVSGDLSITPDKATLKPGQTCMFTSNASGVTFSISNPSVATVAENGIATAVAAGTATISVSRGSLTATALLMVEDFIISASSLSVGEGLTASLSSNAVEGEVVTWSSSNPAVATVSSEGLITGVAKGTTTITATCEGLTATCLVTVKEALRLTQHSADMLVTSKITLTANYPSSDITWSSPGFTVSSAGLVTPGSTSIWSESIQTYYVYASYEGMTDSCLVTSYPLPHFSMYPNGSTKTIHLSSAGTLDMAIYSDADFTLSTSASGIISYEVVSSSNATSGKDYKVVNITPKSTGSVVLTATYKGSVSVLQGQKAYVTITIDNK